MNKTGVIFLLWSILPAFIAAQPLAKRQQYDIAKDKVLYTIGYAHLDTEWNWEYPTTINQYIRNTMEDNFKLFEKYPDYVFNFTGSRRYKMMKEYYPESYKKVADYIKQGRWFVSGSSVDEGEVNISSSESVIRQVLYGNLFFRREFNKESYDYMLPDCFGFVATMPQVWNHAGLLGFSTQKLTWRSSNGIPFNIGIWEGPDGKGLLAALNATDYTGRVVSRLDKDSTWNARIQDGINKYGVSFDFRYYGVGDIGGSPREEDVKNVVGSLRNSDSKFKVILTSSDQIYKDITPELRKKLPTYSGDLLLIEHSAGSMTSQSYMKRANRKNEILAKSAEQASVLADWIGGAAYPAEKLNSAWELVLGSQFHDILPGTSTVKAYEYAWNDEFIAMNTFSEVLKNAVSNISRSLNTQVEGRSVVVFNPVARTREDIVTAELIYPKLPVNVRVTDKDGNSLPSQIISAKGNKLTVIFLAKLPSAGFSVFGIQETTDKQTSSELFVTDQTLENKFFKVKIDANGDIAGIYDKRAAREVLSKPATLDFQLENPSQWPAWNMDWKDRKNPPIDYMNKNATINIIEQGPVRVAIEVIRKGQNSEITQIISLAAGESGKIVEVRNKIDWQSKGVSLKAAFPTTVVNEFATYSLNTAAVQRATNNEIKFEVPGRQWIDITDRSNNYGVSILEDCKYGSDKPDNSTLRLTLMYTPKASSYIYQGTQDWGVHDVKYGIYPHIGDWVYAKTPWQGNFLNNPPVAFETTKHNGPLGKEISIIQINTNQVDVMAIKKAEESDYYIVRFNELYGKEAKNVVISFRGRITEAFEVNGQEQKIGIADFANGNLNFDMGKFAIRTFAVKFENIPLKLSKPLQQVVTLAYNGDGFSSDNRRNDGNIVNNLTIPAELIPAEVVSEDIIFKVGNTSDNQKNMLITRGQKINLPPGDFNKLYILAAADEDTQGAFKVGSKTINIPFQNWTGYVGQHYGRVLYFNNMKVASITNAFTRRDNIAWFASHRHNPDANDAYQYSYLYKYEISLPKGVRSVKLPDNSRIKVFAMTLTNNQKDEITPLQPLYDDFTDNKPVKLRVNEIVTLDLKPLTFLQQPLFTESVDERMLPRLKQYLRNAGLDTILVITQPSSNDYADVNSGNKVTAAYYPAGKSSRGIEYSGQKFDIPNILNTKTGVPKDTLFFDNGEGRVMIDLQKPVSIDRINMFFETFRGRGSQPGQQIFSIWASLSGSDVTGDPKTKGWQFVGVYGTGGRGFGGSGTSYVFDNNLKCRYLMFISDGSWHGTDYVKQLDIFEKK
ncbi:MAG: glycosyl hydrolase-related protein [Bacteroidales bacterium]|nr:glycosyl hydrolase-related protein [Bacteroidales bacterium]